MSVIPNPASSAIYLDGHATTPLAPEAEAAMSEWWHIKAANAHSPHGGGHRAATAVETAREQVAGLVGASANEIIFTSGATEANAIALLGTAKAARRRGDPRRKILVSTIEHKSVLESAAELAHEGFDVQHVPVDSNSVVDLAALASLTDDTTLLVSIMAANNEVGVLQPLAAIAAIARKSGAVAHTDASQLAGKLATDLADFDLASLSSHKMYGPAGVGALFVSSACPIRPLPLFAGGSQEQGIRPGTLPVPLIVGFGAAADLARDRLILDAKASKGLADRLVVALRNFQVDFKINGEGADRLPGSLNIQIYGCSGSSIVSRLQGCVYLAEGSACTSGQIIPSHVLKATGLSNSQASECIRIYCGRYNTEAEIDRAATMIAAAAREEIASRWTDPPVGSRHEKYAARI
ncbi:cysteine desulfurase family protein [Brevundimonas sp.]|uniref:cysteine desulfurase family protein n=1 Tax=Brevundimonas sp. TaxID=1871086 RepID=UPI001A2385C2|nr:cysteine desulfurase family protein [Brevundimonas sp.]MBJ7483498.1 cysteine desulfurase [Brevundimonas sp.]